SPRAPGEYEPEDGEHHGPRESGHGVVGLHESSVPPSRYGVRVRTLDQPAYPDDDGAVDPAVQAAVDEYARGGQFGDVLVALGLRGSSCPWWRCRPAPHRTRGLAPRDKRRWRWPRC